MEQFKYRGKFIQVSEENIAEQIFERVYLPSGVIIFPLIIDPQDNQEKVLLIVEKRPHETPNTRLKFVSGHLEANEDPLETANRELQEEIGFKAQTLQLIHHHQSNGTVNNQLYFFSAHQLSPSKIPNPDGEDTILEIRQTPLADLLPMALSGELQLAFPALGFLKWLKIQSLI